MSSNAHMGTTLAAFFKSKGADREGVVLLRRVFAVNRIALWWRDWEGICDAAVAGTRSGRLNIQVYRRMKSSSEKPSLQAPPEAFELRRTYPIKCAINQPAPSARYLLLFTTSEALKSAKLFHKQSEDEEKLLKVTGNDKAIIELVAGCGAGTAPMNPRKTRRALRDFSSAWWRGAKDMERLTFILEHRNAPTPAGRCAARQEADAKKLRSRINAKSDDQMKPVQTPSSRPPSTFTAPTALFSQQNDSPKTITAHNAHLEKSNEERLCESRRTRGAARFSTSAEDDASFFLEKESNHDTPTPRDTQDNTSDAEEPLPPPSPPPPLTPEVLEQTHPTKINETPEDLVDRSETPILQANPRMEVQPEETALPKADTPTREEEEEEEVSPDLPDPPDVPLKENVIDWEVVPQKVSTPRDVSVVEVCQAPLGDAEVSREGGSSGQSQRNSESTVVETPLSSSSDNGSASTPFKDASDVSDGVHSEVEKLEEPKEAKEAVVSVVRTPFFPQSNKQGSLTQKFLSEIYFSGAWEAMESEATQHVLNCAPAMSPRKQKMASQQLGSGSLFPLRSGSTTNNRRKKGKKSFQKLNSLDNVQGSFLHSVDNNPSTPLRATPDFISRSHSQVLHAAKLDLSPFGQINLEDRLSGEERFAFYSQPQYRRGVGGVGVGMHSLSCRILLRDEGTARTALSAEEARLRAATFLQFALIREVQSKRPSSTPPTRRISFLRRMSAREYVTQELGAQLSMAKAKRQYRSAATTCPTNHTSFDWAQLTPQEEEREEEEEEEEEDVESEWEENGTPFASAFFESNTFSFLHEDSFDVKAFLARKTDPPQNQYASFKKFHESTAQTSPLGEDETNGAGLYDSDDEAARREHAEQQLRYLVGKLGEGNVLSQRAYASGLARINRVGDLQIFLHIVTSGLMHEESVARNVLVKKEITQKHLRKRMQTVSGALHSTEARLRAHITQSFYESASVLLMRSVNLKTLNGHRTVRLLCTATALFSLVACVSLCAAGDRMYCVRVHTIVSGHEAAAKVVRVEETKERSVLADVSLRLVELAVKLPRRLHKAEQRKRDATVKAELADRRFTVAHKKSYFEIFAEGETGLLHILYQQENEWRTALQQIQHNAATLMAGTPERFVTFALLEAEERGARTHIAEGVLRGHLEEMEVLCLMVDVFQYKMEHTMRCNIIAAESSAWESLNIASTLQYHRSIAISHFFSRLQMGDLETSVRTSLDSTRESALFTLVGQHRTQGANSIISSEGAERTTLTEQFNRVEVEEEECNEASLLAHSAFLQETLWREHDAKREEYEKMCRVKNGLVWCEALLPGYDGVECGWVISRASVDYLVLCFEEIAEISVIWGEEEEVFRNTVLQKERSEHATLTTLFIQTGNAFQAEVTSALQTLSTRASDATSAHLSSSSLSFASKASACLSLFSTNALQLYHTTLTSAFIELISQLYFFHFEGISGVLYEEYLWEIDADEFERIKGEMIQNYAELDVKIEAETTRCYVQMITESSIQYAVDEKEKMALFCELLEQSVIHSESSSRSFIEVDTACGHHLLSFEFLLIAHSARLHSVFACTTLHTQGTILSEASSRTEVFLSERCSFNTILLSLRLEESVERKTSILRDSIIKTEASIREEIEKDENLCFEWCKRISLANTVYSEACRDSLHTADQTLETQHRLCSQMFCQYVDHMVSWQLSFTTLLTNHNTLSAITYLCTKESTLRQNITKEWGVGFAPILVESGEQFSDILQRVSDVQKGKLYLEVARLNAKSALQRGYDSALLERHIDAAKDTAAMTVRLYDTFSTKVATLFTTSAGTILFNIYVSLAEDIVHEEEPAFLYIAESHYRTTIFTEEVSTFLHITTERDIAIQSLHDLALSELQTVSTELIAKHITHNDTIFAEVSLTLQNCQSSFNLLCLSQSEAEARKDDLCEESTEYLIVTSTIILEGIAVEEVNAFAILILGVEVLREVGMERRREEEGWCEIECSSVVSEYVAGTMEISGEEETAREVFSVGTDERTVRDEVRCDELDRRRRIYLAEINHKENALRRTHLIAYTTPLLLFTEHHEMQLRKTIQNHHQTTLLTTLEQQSLELSERSQRKALDLLYTAHSTTPFCPTMARIQQEMLVAEETVVRGGEEVWCFGVIYDAQLRITEGLLDAAGVGGQVGESPELPTAVTTSSSADIESLASVEEFEVLQAEEHLHRRILGIEEHADYHHEVTLFIASVREAVFTETGRRVDAIVDTEEELRQAIAKHQHSSRQELCAFIRDVF